MPRVALVLGALLLAVGAHAANRPVAAVAPFIGPGARPAEIVVLKTLRKSATILPQAQWNRSAKKLFANTHSAEDVAAVAGDVGAEVVVTGTVKRDGRRWQLAISVRNGKTGKARERLRYPIKGPRPRISPATLALLSREIVDAFATALAPEPTETAEPPPEPPPPEPERRPKVAQAAPPRSEAPPAAKETPEPAAKAAPVSAPEQQMTAKAPERRPRWAPYFDVAAGLSLTGRSFVYDPTTNNQSFGSGVDPGIHAKLVLYPLAATWKSAYGLFAGLGAYATVDKPVWPDSTVKGMPGQKYATSELRVEGGLRWRVVLYKPLPRPELVVDLGGGLHNFVIAKDANGFDVGPADVAYKYLTIGGGPRIHFTEWAALYAGFNYHVVFTAGPVNNSASEYGPANSSGLRFLGGFEFFLYKGLKVDLEGFYERFSLKFLGGGIKIANSGTDQYFGGFVSLGYML